MVQHANRDRRPQRKRRLSAASYRAAPKLQGRYYMGTMRGVPAAKRAMVKKGRASHGIRDAIAEAQRLAS